MNGFHLSAEACRLFREKWALWLLVGAGATIADLAFPLIEVVRFGSRPPLGAKLLTSAGSTLVGFFAAAALVQVALLQAETGRFEFRKLIVGREFFIPLALLAAGAFVCTWARFLAWYPEAARFEGLRWLISMALGIPFVLAIPLVVTGRLSALEAATMSARLVLPRFFQVLTAEFSVLAITAALLAPVGCLFGFFGGASRAMPLAMVFYSAGSYVIGLPLYYACVVAIYRERTGV